MNLEQLGAPAADAAGRTRQTLGELRRGGWLLELERALFNADASQSAPATGSDNGATGGQHRAGTGADETDDTLGSRKPTGPDATAPTDAQAHADAGATALATRWQRGTATPCWPLQAGLAGALHRSDQTAAPADAANAPPVALPSRNGGGFGLHLFAPRAPAPSGVPVDQPPYGHPASGTEAGAPAAPDPQYARRQIHLYHGAGGVQAWVRDAQLALPDAASLAWMLRRELQASGLTLSALTLNGRPVANPGETSRSAAAPSAAARPEQDDVPAAAGAPNTNAQRSDPK